MRGGDSFPKDVPVNRRARAAMRDLVERLRAEQRERWRRGDRVPAEEYLVLHAGLLGEELSLELIYQEVVLRAEQGEAPQKQEEQRRFPHLAERLGQLFEVHSALAPGSGGPPSATASDEAIPSTLAGPVGGWRTLRPPAPPPADLPLIPGYEVLEKLGQGGMGVV